MSNEQAKFYIVIFGSPTNKHFDKEKALETAKDQIMKGKVSSAYIFELTDKITLRKECEVIPAMEKEITLGEVLGEVDNIAPDELGEVAEDEDNIIVGADLAQGALAPNW